MCRRWPDRENARAARTYVRAALSDVSCRIETARNVSEAYDRIQHATPDLIVLDLGLPDGDGLDILATIRKDRRCDETVVLVLSASDEVDLKVRSLDLGAQDVLTKPIHPRELNARVRSQIRRKRKHDAILAEYQHLTTLSLTDPLTGAYNRRAMDRLLRARLSESVRYEIPISCLMFDIDHFKKVNDTHGHGVGDRVLKEISALPVFRQEDVLIRYGGEEFLVILFHTTRDGAHTFGERLRTEVAATPFDSRNATIHITLSAGIAAHPEDRTIKDTETMLTLSDRRLYAAKRSGRNRVVSRD